ncbi:transcriptional regulator [marine bacterium AO1-C]|nr:transcriptional regulator [marine bacterium AO1-C]
MNKENQKKYYCPIDVTIKTIGGKWKPIILHHLLSGTKRFGELRKLIPDITQKMLTQQLRELEQDALVARKIYPEVPPKVEYSLTDYGTTLKQVLTELSKWGVMHTANNNLVIEKPTHN